MNLKVGLQLYTVRQSMEKDFEGTLRAVRDMGYEYVELAGYFGKSSEEIKKTLDELGLKCVSVHQKPDFFDEDFDAKVDFLRGFGTKYAIIPWYDKSKLAGSAVWEDTKEYFRTLADKLAARGMMLGYHNHDFEFEKHDGKYLHDYIFEAIDADKIMPEIDTCWVRYAGLDPAEKLRQFKGRVPIVHLKDFKCKNLAQGPVYDLIGTDGKPAPAASKEDNEFEFRPVGYGMQDFKSILEACEECGTEIVIVEQDKTYDKTELEAARLSREYLKNTFGI